MKGKRNLARPSQQGKMIEINNLTTNPVDEEFLKNIASKVLQGEKAKERELSVALIGQGRMRKLNKRHRKKNRVTDVLAFSNHPGEVVICLREVKKNAQRFSTTFEKEIARCLIHGILHLLGYEHENDEEAAKKMEKRQEYYLSQSLP